jgi:hypothetical protein
MFDPVTKQMFEMIRGYRVSQIVGTLAELQIPDVLQTVPLLMTNSPRKLDANPKLPIGFSVHPRASAS